MGLPIATKAGGVVQGMPNVCLTPAPPAPPVPVPYPSMGKLAEASGAVEKVEVQNKPTITEGSKIPSTLGDAAGKNGGVVSGTTGDAAAPKTFSSKVTLAGKKVVVQTATFAMNGTSPNLPGGVHAAASQGVVFAGV